MFKYIYIIVILIFTFIMYKKIKKWLRPKKCSHNHAIVVEQDMDSIVHKHNFQHEHTINSQKIFNTYTLHKHVPLIISCSFLSFLGILCLLYPVIISTIN